VIEKAVKTFEKIEGVDVELAERLVEQGILSYDDLSVMEISDLVNTIEGLTEEQAASIVEQAETLAEEQGEELPRRKSGRSAAALAEGREGGEPPPPAGPVDGEAAAGDELGEEAVEPEESGPFDGEPEGAEATIEDDAEETDRDDASPPDGEDDSSHDEAAEAEGDEANEDEYHDVALAEESSGRPGHGHEVTSAPSDDDQSETLRIVTDVVENGETPPAASNPEPSARPENGARGKGPKAGAPPAGD
jgi:N utilization substance protein A